MGDNKYIDLISTASVKEFSGNQPATFTNRLAKPLVLDGDWEVGLLEVVHPRITTKLIHEGTVFLGGNVPQSYEQTFKIDSSKPDPFSELQIAANRITSKVTGASRPELNKDPNGIYRIWSGEERVVDKWEVVSHLIIYDEFLRFVGLNKDAFKVSLQGKTFESKEKAMIHDNLAPQIPANIYKTKIDVWVKGAENLPQMPFEIQPNETVQIIVKKLNEEVGKYFSANNFADVPQPIFGIGKDGRFTYTPGLVRTYKMEPVILKFDRGTMQMLGFIESDVDSLVNKEAKYRATAGASHMVYFYTDIVQEHHQGDIMGSSLRVLPVHKHKEMFHNVFNPIVYHPVRIKNISTITASINDELGRNPDFEAGTLHATLHFRKMKKLY